MGSIWWIRMGAVTGLLAIVFQSMGEFSLQMPGNAALFAVIAGLAAREESGHIPHDEVRRKAGLAQLLTWVY